MLISVSLSVSLADDKKEKKDGPQIKFERDVYDFGKIEKGQIAKYKFVFKNNGNAPLILTEVKASCGCTTPTWSKEPVLPGEKGFVEAAYNSNSGNGTFAKSITVTTNIPDKTVVLFIKGEVIVNPADDPSKKSPIRTNND